MTDSEVSSYVASSTNKGKTIQLTRNVTVTGNINNICPTIDLNGFELDIQNMGRCNRGHEIYLYGDIISSSETAGKVILNTPCTNTHGMYRGFTCQGGAGGNLFSNVNLGWEGDKVGFLIATSNSNVTIENCTLGLKDSSYNYAVNVNANPQQILIQDCEFEGEATGWSLNLEMQKADTSDPTVTLIGEIPSVRITTDDYENDLNDIDSSNAEIADMTLKMNTSSGSVSFDVNSLMESLQEKNVIVETTIVYVEVPGPTEYIEVPGETVYVEVPGETEYIEVPGPTKVVYKEVPFSLDTDEIALIALFIIGLAVLGYLFYELKK